MGANSSFTMVIGGASSGKSSFAERLVMSQPGPHIYLATARAFDDEMREKIASHQRDRENAGWITIEEPLRIQAAISNLPKDVSILIDCATMWLNNLLMDDQETRAETTALLDYLGNQSRNVTIVTNEVGLGIVPENKLARRFRIAQGALNAAIAAQADLVVGVMAGLPFALKGDLP